MGIDVAFDVTVRSGSTIKHAVSRTDTLMVTIFALDPKSDCLLNSMGSLVENKRNIFGV